MMVKNNICCFGDIIGKTDLCIEMTVAILAIFRFAGCFCFLFPSSSFLSADLSFALISLAAANPPIKLVKPFFPFRTVGS